MRRILFLLALSVLLISCDQEPTRVTLVDSNRDAVAHLSPDPEILGNTELFFIPVTIQGSAIWIINGPGANVGMDIRDIDNPSFIYYADSYISKGSNSAQTGTQIPWDKWMRVRLVVYNSGLSGIIVSLIEAMGLDFFESIEAYMIERIYTTDVFLSADGTRFSRPLKEFKDLSPFRCENIKQ